MIVPENDESGERAEQNWPDLLRICLQMCVDQEHPSHIERRICALEMLEEIVDIYPKSLRNIQSDMHKLLEGCFSDAEPRIRKCAVVLVISMVSNFRAREWKPLQPCIPVILRVIENLAQLKLDDELTDVLQKLSELAETEPLFFKPNISEVAELLHKIACEKQMSDEPRSGALEFLMTLGETKPIMCVKNCPQYVSYILKAAMDCMLDVSTDDEAWAAVMEDEEDGDDDSELYQIGMEVVDRLIATFTIKRVGSAYFEAIGSYVKQADWQSVHAALTAISEGVEHVEKKEHLDELFSVALEHTKYLFQIFNPFSSDPSSYLNSTTSMFTSKFLLQFSVHVSEFPSTFPTRNTPSEPSNPSQTLLL